MGLVGGIIAAPCTGPVLASVLAFVATTRSVALGGSLLFTYALGMGVLFFVIAAFAVRCRSRARGWRRSRAIFGVVMMVAALYFLRNVVAAARLRARTLDVASACRSRLAASACALGGDPPVVPRRAAEARAQGARRGAARRRRLRRHRRILLSARPSPKPLEWINGETAGVAARSAAHKPALLDFYADWCLPCKEMELKTFDKAEVARELGRFTLVKVDTTHDDDPAVIDAKKRYGADTLPTVVLLDADGKVVQHAQPLRRGRTSCCRS